MNFLAHLALSHFSPPLQVGNFLGDFLRGRASLDRLPAPIRRGVDMHRAIDRFTDAHPAVRALNARLRTRHGRYASVITDIGFDHYLHRNWAELGPGDFDDFCQETYRHLYAARHLMDDRVRGYVEGMVKDDWLQLYTTTEGMHRVFGRLRPRLSRPALLDGVQESLRQFDREFDTTFRTFYPQLQDLAATYRDPA